MKVAGVVGVGVRLEVVKVLVGNVGKRREVVGGPHEGMQGEFLLVFFVLFELRLLT